MNKTKKTWIRILSAVLIWIQVLMMPICRMEVCAQIELTSPSAILMEASTGTVLFEKNESGKKFIILRKKRRAIVRLKVHFQGVRHLVGKK